MPGCPGKGLDTEMNVMPSHPVPAKVRVVPDQEGPQKGAADAGVGSS